MSSQIIISIPVLLYCASIFLFVYYNIKCFSEPLEQRWRQYRLLFFVSSLAFMVAIVSLVDYYKA